MTTLPEESDLDGVGSSSVLFPTMPRRPPLDPEHPAQLAASKASGAVRREVVHAWEAGAEHGYRSALVEAESVVLSGEDPLRWLSNRIRSEFPDD